MNLLDDALIRVERRGVTQRLSLPQVYAALVTDEIDDFVALRPHQRHALHTLLCQIGAVACVAAARAEPPPDAETWAGALRALTPEYSDDAPWRLVTPPDRPAFLQAPAPDGIKGFKAITTPDALDMLVTSKNHDVKALRMEQPEPDDWLFSLVTLQTMEGFLGAGNYGISRMNGGFANRPGIGLAPAGGRIGLHVMRDVRRLLVLRPRILRDYPYYQDGGLSLVWLRPWTGLDSIDPGDFDPFYVEICRRVRLIEQRGRLSAVGTGSKVPRIAPNKAASGITGDPWTPIDLRNGEAKALTIDARGFSYRRMTDILTGSGYKPAPLQEIGPDENGERVLVCRALARGQGKTEGYHERHVPVSREAVLALRRGETERIAGLAKSRITDVGKVRAALQLALLALFQNGKSELNFRDPSSKGRADVRLGEFETMVDADFFERLWEELALPEGTVEAARVRASWLNDLLARARDVLAAAEAGSPQSSVRSYRARARAEGTLNGRFRAEFASYFPRETAGAAAP